MPGPQATNTALEAPIRRHQRTTTGVLTQKIVRRAVTYTGLGLLALLYVFPLLWVLASSLKGEQGYVLHPQNLIPDSIHLTNYIRAWTDAKIGQYFGNSLITTVTTTALTTLFSAMAAYVLGRFSFRGRNIIYVLFLAGLMLPVWLGYVPIFFLALDFHMLNQLYGYIIINVGWHLAFTIFFLTPFFASLPTELEEAAVIDGAGPFEVFWKVMAPLAQPGLLTVAIFNMLGMWNEYDLALILLQEPAVNTIPIGIAQLFVQQGFRADYGALFAGLVIVMLPSLILYAIFTDRLVEGITVGALKG